MASLTYEPTETWSPGARFHATQDVDLLITNTTPQRRVRYEITDSDDLPALAERRAHILYPGATEGMQLKTGERLWFAVPLGASDLNIAPQITVLAK